MTKAARILILFSLKDSQAQSKKGLNGNMRKLNRINVTKLCREFT